MVLNDAGASPPSCNATPATAALFHRQEQLSAVVPSNASLSAAEGAAIVLELSRQTAGPDPLRVIRPKTR